MHYVSFRCKYDSSVIHSDFSEPSDLKSYEDIKSVLNNMSTYVEDVRTIKMDIIKYLRNEGYINYNRTPNKYITFCIDLKYKGDNEIYYELLNSYQSLLRENKINSILEK